MKTRATNNQNNQNNQNKTQPQPIQVSSYSIGRVREAADGVVFADVCINGVMVYGCSIRATQAGEAFLAWPSKKGQDGKWYKNAWAPLSETDQDKIIQAVYDKLDGKA